MAQNILQETADRLGFQTGNSRVSRQLKLAYGVYNDIVFNVTPVGGVVIVTACISSLDSLKTESIKAFLKENKKTYGIRLNETVFSANTVTVKLFKAFGAINSDTIFLFTDAFSQHLQFLGFSHGCSLCGAPGEHAYSSTDAGVCMICEPCFTEYQNKVESIKQDREISGSYATGAVGAVLGAAVGVIPWVLVGMLGYIAALCGLAMAWLAFKGYQLFNGKLGKGTIVILVVVLLIMTPVAVLASNAAIAAKDGTLDYFDGNVLYMVQAFFLIPEILSALLREFLMGLVFTGLGAFSFLRKIGRTSTSKDIEIARM